MTAVAPAMDAEAGGVSASTSRRRGRIPRVDPAPSRAVSSVILVVAGLAFLLPLAAMFEFSLRDGAPVKGVQPYSFRHYSNLFDPANSFTYQGLFQGVVNSLVIALLTVALVLLVLLPTMILVELRFPTLRRVLEFVCILPITIPTVVLVVGFVPVYSLVARVFGSTSWTLFLAIGVIVLPYAYRPIAANIAAVELGILSEASRSLGAGWGATLARVILPNLRRGVFAAAFITIAVVLGEYTIAAFLSQNTFQTALVQVDSTDPYATVILSLAALTLVFALLVLIGRVGQAGPGRRSRVRAASTARRIP